MAAGRRVAVDNGNSAGIFSPFQMGHSTEWGPVITEDSTSLVGEYECVMSK
jgi:hypothetical protein